MMGRLFWKLLLFIWLGQMAAVLGTGALFEIEHSMHPEHRPPHEHVADGHPPGRTPHDKPDAHEHGGPPGLSAGGWHVPWPPVIAGGIASLFCAFGLAWYFAKPIRRLHEGIAQVSDGRLEVRISDAMGDRQDELADLGRAFDEMLTRIHCLVEGQQRLLHDVSHELRSPLARLHAAIALLRQRPERTDESLQRIEREAERMNTLVEELLTLSRLEAGVGGLVEAVDLSELTEGLVEDLRFEARLKSVTVAWQPALDVWVMAPPVALQRAIENVLRNALRFSPEAAVIQVALVKRSTFAELTVKDSGPGVPESELDTIFTPFFRSESARQQSGYGLGLAIARRAIQTVEGQIQASNQSTGGLVVKIVLPLTSPPDEVSS